MLLGFSITNEENYNDNLFGRLFEGMMKDSVYETLVVFRNHIIRIVLDEENNYLFKLNEIEKREDNYFDVKPETKLRKCDCHKYIGYSLFTLLRPEYGLEDTFPVKELEFIFVYNVDDYVYKEECEEE